MKTIKLVDLLVKIANKEEVPKMVKYHNYILTYDEETQDYYNEPSCTYSLLDDIHYKLNDIVEIIEDTPKEDNKIEKIDIRTDSTGTEYVVGKRFGKAFGKAYVDYAEKINEIIDVVNQLKKQPPIININGPQTPFMQEPYKITCSTSGKESDK